MRGGYSRGSDHSSRQEERPQGEKMGKVMDGGGREQVKVAGTQAPEEGR